MEVHTVLDGIGCVYNNFVVNDHFVSVAGPTGEIIDSQPPMTKLCSSA
jgi:hypothetical protein